ncbi:MAG TPA: hypothetical protein VJ023_14675 [Pyrinomonadaceae bacterium]|nr:hypothetical protein [Pyrinomonadaceae bacterium]
MPGDVSRATLATAFNLNVTSRLHYTRVLTDSFFDNAITFARCPFQAGAIENLHATATVFYQPFLQKFASGKRDAVALMPAYWQCAPE